MISPNPNPKGGQTNRQTNKQTDKHLFTPHSGISSHSKELVQGGPTSRDGFRFQIWRLSCRANHQPGQTVTKEVTATKDMVKSGSMSASEVDAAHLPASARSKKKNGRLAKFGRHARFFKSFCGRSTGVEDYDNVNSQGSKMYDNTTFSLDLDESVGLMVQHPPKKQVATKTDKKGK